MKKGKEEEEMGIWGEKGGGGEKGKMDEEEEEWNEVE